MRLRPDQLDLIVIIAKRIRDVAYSDGSTQTVDVIGRKLARRRCDELIADVIAVYPEAGEVK